MPIRWILHTDVARYRHCRQHDCFHRFYTRLGPTTPALGLSLPPILFYLLWRSLCVATDAVHHNAYRSNSGPIRH